MGVHDGGDGVVVDVTITFGDVFDGGNGFFFGFVGEHGTEGAVADNTDVGEFGPVLFVDYKTAFVIDFEADVFETKASGIGTAPYGYKDNVGVELEDRSVDGILDSEEARFRARTYSFFLATFCSLNFDLDGLTAVITLENFCAQLEFHALLF